MSPSTSLNFLLRTPMNLSFNLSHHNPTQPSMRGVGNANFAPRHKILVSMKPNSKLCLLYSLLPFKSQFTIYIARIRQFCSCSQSLCYQGHILLVFVPFMIQNASLHFSSLLGICYCLFKLGYLHIFSGKISVSSLLAHT